MDRAIESVAILVDDGPAFRLAAQAIAQKYGPTSLPELRRRFHRSPPAPPGFTASERGLTGWMSFWQFAIFEIIYQFREHALPLLRQVAFGNYDWTQANAIELLCRLAAEGIDRDRTLADLKRKMPGMRGESLSYAAEPLLKMAQGDPAIASIVTELCQIDVFATAVDELRELGEF